jgi:hypothetical protein
MPQVVKPHAGRSGRPTISELARQPDEHGGRRSTRTHKQALKPKPLPFFSEPKTNRARSTTRSISVTSPGPNSSRTQNQSGPPCRCGPRASPSMTALFANAPPSRLEFAWPSWHRNPAQIALSDLDAKNPCRDVHLSRRPARSRARL